MAVVGQDADSATWNTVKAQLDKTDVAEVRGWLLRALGAARNPELVVRVRALALDPTLRATEVTSPLLAQLQEPPLREATWAWVKDHFDALLGVVPAHFGKLQLIGMASVFCDEAHASDVEAFFTPARLAKIEGGPRELASTLEGIRLCAARRKVQEPSARELFGRK
jgi:alanyl aminopeptidase